MAKNRNKNQNMNQQNNAEFAEETAAGRTNKAAQNKQNQNANR